MLININEINRQSLLNQTLNALPKGARLPDAGADELTSRKYYGHLNYLSQDFCEHNENASEEGLQTKN